jgi:hypothetical protein
MSKVAVFLPSGGDDIFSGDTRHSALPLFKSIAASFLEGGSENAPLTLH